MTLDPSRPTSSSRGLPLDVPSPSPAAGLDRVTPDGSPLLTKPLPARHRRRVRLKKPKKDSKIYKAVLATIALRAQGMKTAEIAEQLGYKEQTLFSYMKHAAKLKWIDLDAFDDPEDGLEYVLKHKIVKNISAVLDEKDVDSKTGAETSRLSNRAIEVTLESAKGTGLFKQHQVVKSDAQANVGVALRVMVEMPPLPTAGNTVPSVRPGTVGGAPALDIPIDADIIT